MFGRLFVRRRLQFSLRAFLVALTAVCVALGWWIVPKWRQRELVAEILQAGAEVSYPGEYDPMIGPTSNGFSQGRGAGREGPSIWRDLMSAPIYVQFHHGGATDDLCGRLANIPSLQFVSLGGSPITDASLSRLAGLTQLIGLGLDGIRITDAGLLQISRMKRLQYLWLEGTNVSDDGLAFLKDLSDLDMLVLKHTPITDKGLEHLIGLKKLNILLLRGSKITDEGVRRFKEAVPKCRVFLTKSEWIPPSD